MVPSDLGGGSGNLKEISEVNTSVGMVTESETSVLEPPPPRSLGETAENPSTEFTPTETGLGIPEALDRISVTPTPSDVCEVNLATSARNLVLPSPMTPGGTNEDPLTRVTPIATGVGGLIINEDMITLDVIMTSDEDRFSEVNSICTEFRVSGK